MLQFENLLLRKAKVEDALQLVSWWNDGEVMSHAGFPNGVGVQVDEVVALIKKNSENRCQYILDIDGVPVGEMHYRKKEDICAEIGIKICDKKLHNKGMGKKALSLLINHLFDTHKCQMLLVNVSKKNKMAQHVYEQLGFKEKNALKKISDKYLDKNSSIKYELLPTDFVDYLK
ncbi:MAG: GNAT family N-acetyltransferase [Alphaproteobacteria bacterium]|nr:GNAT family N-acetyltransferase [Alphaproteobacteria bacterium]